MKPITVGRTEHIAKLKAEVLTQFEVLATHKLEQGSLQYFHIDARNNRLIWYTDSESEPRHEGVLAEVETSLELVEITSAVYGRLQQLRHPPEKQPYFYRMEAMD